MGAGMRASSASTTPSSMLATATSRRGELVTQHVGAARPRRGRRSSGRSRRRPRPRPGRASTAKTGANPSLAAATARTPEPQPASSRLPRSSRARSSMQARVVGCAPVPNARPGSTTTAGSPAGGGSHGGPIQSPPARARGGGTAFQRSSHPPRRARRARAETRARISASPAVSVYTASSSDASCLALLEACRERSMSHARAISASAVGNEDGDAADAAQRSALFRRLKNPSPSSSRDA